MYVHHNVAATASLVVISKISPIIFGFGMDPNTGKKVFRPKTLSLFKSFPRFLSVAGKRVFA